MGKENRKDFSDRLSRGKWVWEQEGTSGEEGRIEGKNIGTDLLDRGAFRE